MVAETSDIGYISFCTAYKEILLGFGARIISIESVIRRFRNWSLEYPHLRREPLSWERKLLLVSFKRSGYLMYTSLNARTSSFDNPDKFGHIWAIVCGIASRSKLGWIRDKSKKASNRTVIMQERENKRSRHSSMPFFFLVRVLITKNWGLRGVRKPYLEKIWQGFNMRNSYEIFQFNSTLQ